MAQYNFIDSLDKYQLLSQIKLAIII